MNIIFFSIKPNACNLFWFYINCSVLKIVFCLKFKLKYSKNIDFDNENELQFTSALLI